jgi:alpha-1,2-mannosyltransferase
MIERTVVALVLGLGLACPIIAAASAIANAAPESPVVPWVTGTLLAASAVAAAWQMRHRLPSSLDGAARRHPKRAGLWALLALAALLQLGRLSAFMADPSNTFGSAFPDPGLTRHMCMSAYVQAAALARDGDSNIYNERHWPAFSTSGSENVGAPSAVTELGPYIADPYEYPPQFLLLPRLALAVTNHFLVIRAVWFLLQCIAFTAVGLALAAWIGEREGLVIGLLVPAIIASIPLLVNLQWGQAHLLTLTLSMGALIAFNRGRTRLGGLLLGAATMFKLFPALLLVYLALRRRWREVGFTLAACVALTVLAWVVLGTAPFVEFFRYQLPRIASGDAFSFFRREWFYVSRNMGVSGIVFKLGLWGVPGMDAAAASAVGWVYTLILFALVVRAARQPDRPPLEEALLWMGLLCLGSLRSPLAPGIYVAVGALWLLTLFAARVRRSRDILFIALAFLIIPGGPPLQSAPVDVAIASIGQGLMLVIAFRAVWGANANRTRTQLFSDSVSIWRRFVRR